MYLKNLTFVIAFKFLFFLLSLGTSQFYVKEGVICVCDVVSDRKPTK